MSLYDRSGNVAARLAENLKVVCDDVESHHLLG